MALMLSGPVSILAPRGPVLASAIRRPHAHGHLGHVDPHGADVPAGEAVGGRGTGASNVLTTEIHPELVGVAWHA